MLFQAQTEQQLYLPLTLLPVTSSACLSLLYFCSWHWFPLSIRHISLQSPEHGSGEKKKNGVWGRGDEARADKMWRGWSEIEMQSCKSRGKAPTREWGRRDREEESSWKWERNAGRGKIQSRLMQHKLEFSIYLLNYYLETKVIIYALFLSFIVFLSWFLFSALIWILLVCLPKVIFLPPTPAGTFFLSPQFFYNPHVCLLK